MTDDPAGDGVPLRRGRRAVYAGLWPAGIGLLICVVIGLIAAFSTHDVTKALSGLLIGAILAGCVGVSTWNFRHHTRYRLYGDVLVARGRWAGRVALPDVTEAVVARHARRGSWWVTLELHDRASGDQVRMLLGDDMFRCHFDPAILETLATRLERSPHPEVVSTAMWLRAYADPKTRVLPPIE